MEERIRQAVEAAEMVLVGIGGEFTPEPPAKWREGELEAYYRSRFYEELPESHQVIRAYDSLRELIGVRPYFVVTLNTDDLIYRSKLERDLIVAPCGSMGKLQCGEHILEAREIRERVLAAAEHGEDWRKQAVCPECARPVQFHTIENKDYLERGYLPQWERYTKWLSITLNRRLCVLELGVDFRYPQVIRWPFEKTVFYNQKSLLVRVNSRFPQAARELAERTVSIAESPVSALL